MKQPEIVKSFFAHVQDIESVNPTDGVLKTFSGSLDDFHCIDWAKTRHAPRFIQDIVSPETEEGNSTKKVRQGLYFSIYQQTDKCGVLNELIGVLAGYCKVCAVHLYDDGKAIVQGIELDPRATGGFTSSKFRDTKMEIQAPDAKNAICAKLTGTARKPAFKINFEKWQLQ